MASLIVSMNNDNHHHPLHRICTIRAEEQDTTDCPVCPDTVCTCGLELSSVDEDVCDNCELPLDECDCDEELDEEECPRCGELIENDRCCCPEPCPSCGEVKDCDCSPESFYGEPE